jgi:hypothetical protein
MWRERSNFIRPPHMQRHRDQDLLELLSAFGREKAEGAPLIRLPRGTPKAKNVTLPGQLARTNGLERSHLVDPFF